MFNMDANRFDHQFIFKGNKIRIDPQDGPTVFDAYN